MLSSYVVHIHQVTHHALCYCRVAKLVILSRLLTTSYATFGIFFGIFFHVHTRKYFCIIRKCFSFTGGKGGPDFKGSYKVDNLAAKRIIDSCVKGNVPKVVLISSLLTNGFRAGQFLNPQYLLLNAFGGEDHSVKNRSSTIRPHSCFLSRIACLLPFLNFSLHILIAFQVYCFKKGKLRFIYRNRMRLWITRLFVLVDWKMTPYPCQYYMGKSEVNKPLYSKHVVHIFDDL